MEAKREFDEKEVDVEQLEDETAALEREKLRLEEEIIDEESKRDELGVHKQYHNQSSGDLDGLKAKVDDLNRAIAELADKRWVYCSHLFLFYFIYCCSLMWGKNQSCCRA